MLEYAVGVVLVLGVFGFIGYKVWKKYQADQIVLKDLVDKMTGKGKYDGKGAP